MTNQQEQHIRTMQAEGISVSEIVRTIGLPRTTVQSFLCKGKVIVSCRKSVKRNTCKNGGEGITGTSTKHREGFKQIEKYKKDAVL